MSTQEKNKNQIYVNNLINLIGVNMKKIKFMAIAIVIAVIGMVMPSSVFGQKDTTQASGGSATPECNEYIEKKICTEFGEWYAAETWMSVPGTRSVWKMHYCDVKVFYRWRQCKDYPRNTVEFEILGYYMDLGYKIWVFPYGWLYPCRDALKRLNTGDANDVSMANIDLVTNIFRKLAIHLFDEFRKEAVPAGFPYALCGNSDPDDPNGPPRKFITRAASCMGFCRVQQPFGPIKIKGIEFELDRPPLEYLQEEYTFGTEEQITDIVDLDENDLFELNHFLESEINSKTALPFSPFTSLASTKIVTTPIKCTSDFCCLFMQTLCVDNQGKTVVYEEIKGDIPNCGGYPDMDGCPEGVNQILLPCSQNCK